MTKQELIRKISNDTGVEQSVALSVVESFMDSVRGSLSGKENVYLRGFGSFIIKSRAAKTARNISKNTTITIPAHDIPAFKPCKEFVEAVRKA